jgi:hypothetical protein
MGQDLLSDIQNVSAFYKSNTDFTIEWLNYLSNNKAEAEKILVQKCGDNYFVEGLGQKICINDNKQILLYPSEKLAVYSESNENLAIPDPIETIKSMVQSTDDIVFKWVADLKYYQLNFSGDDGYIEVWIAQHPWRVKKVVQHQAGLNEYNFVFELQQFESSCRGGSEIQLASYIQNTNGKVSLTSAYKDFELQLPQQNTNRK